MNVMNRYNWCSLWCLCLLETFSFGDPAFIDKASEMGCQLNTGQVVCIDFNNDDWVDIYSSGTLWKNNLGKNFSKVFDKGSNAVWADFDNDGYSDFFCYDNQKLFRNVQGKNFVAQSFPDLAIDSCLGASWADFNGDGTVDLYVGGYENWKKNITYPDTLIMNHQGKEWKISWSETRYRARGVTSCDFDQDGDMDVYVSNYRLQPNILWRNDGTGKFVDVSVSHNAVATWKGFAGGHSIGAAWGDFDNDGTMDLFAGNFAHDDSRGHQPHSVFLRNKGSQSDYVFKSMGQCGITYQESYASPAVADYDNDGDLDLFFTTVYSTASFGKKNYPVLYRNDGAWGFVNVSEQEGVSKLGATYQAGWADFNNDGYIDLVSDGKIFINQGHGNSWLKIKLAGDGKKVNADAIGCQVRIKMKDKILTRQVEAGTGQGNQNELTLHFGLGKHQGPVDIEIFWTKDNTQKIHQVKLNQMIKLKFDVGVKSHF
jgi:hypothetical protein